MRPRKKQRPRYRFNRPPFTKAPRDPDLSRWFNPEFIISATLDRIFREVLGYPFPLGFPRPPGRDQPASGRPRGPADPYQVLGLRPVAPREVVEAAYRALVRLHHPDLGHKDGETMRQINRAMDEIRKARGWK